VLAILAPLASLLGIEVATLEARLKRKAVLWGMLATFGLIAVSFILVAMNSALTYAVGPVIAPLLIAGTALLLGVAVFLISHLREAREARLDAERKRSTEITSLAVTAAIAALPLLVPMLRKAIVPAGGALAAAYALLSEKTARRR
jgi:hypothetical protein